MARFDPEPGLRHTDLAEAQKDIDNLHAALTSQPVIEQAKGILMGQNRCSADEAFAKSFPGGQPAAVSESALPRRKPIRAASEPDAGLVAAGPSVLLARSRCPAEALSGAPV